MRSSLLISVAVLSASCVTSVQIPPVLLDFDSAITPSAIPDLELSPDELAIIGKALPKIKPKIDSDILEYAANIATQPEFLSAAAVVATAIPSSVQDQLAKDPGEFIVSLVTATNYPPWVSAIPTGVQGYLLSIGENFASIVDEGPESPQSTPVRGSFVFPTGGFVIPTGLLPQGTAGFPRPTGTGVLPSGTGRISGTGFVTGFRPTATGSGVIPSATGGINGTTPTRGQASPIPFVGGASLPVKRSGSAGAAAAFIGAACWLLA